MTAAPADSPLTAMLKEVLHSVDAGQAYSALALALTLPDICGFIEYPKLRGPGQIGERYQLWCNEWGKILTIDGANCWALRCAYLHNGVDDFSGTSAKKASFKRVQFTVGKVDGVWSSQAQSDGTVRMPHETFCRDMVGAADGWQRKRQHDPAVAQALSELLEIQPA